MTRQRGFTLVELAIVVVIIAIMTGVVLQGRSLIESARTAEVVALAHGLSSAALKFRERYHYLPGDFPVSSSSPELAVDEACRIGGASAGNGNGVIEEAEATCVQDELALAGLLSSGGSMRTAYGSVTIVSASLSGVSGLPSSVVNVVAFQDLPCNIAAVVDGRLDDGDLTTGRVRASEACTGSAAVILAAPL